jgi:hypothetical protein
VASPVSAFSGRRLAKTKVEAGEGVWIATAKITSEAKLWVLTEWNEFRALDLRRVRQVMAGNVLVDLRNVYPETLAGEAGFTYYGIGRASLPVNRTPKERRAQLTKTQDLRPITH